MTEYELKISNCLIEEIINEINKIKDRCKKNNENYLLDNDYRSENAKLRFLFDFFSLFGIHVSVNEDSTPINYVFTHGLIDADYDLDIIDISYYYVGKLVDELNDIICGCINANIDYKRSYKYTCIKSKLSYLVDILKKYDIYAMVYVENYLFEYELFYESTPDYDFIIKDDDFILRKNILN